MTFVVQLSQYEREHYKQSGKRQLLERGLYAGQRAAFGTQFAAKDVERKDTSAAVARRFDLLRY